VQSPAEHRYAQDVELAHGLPRFTRQSTSESPDGTRRRDLKSLEFGVVVEIDGQLWHVGPAFRSDRRRDRQAAADGKVTLRAGWVDVTENACELAIDVTRTLWQRGWTGKPVPCSAACPVARLERGTP
jgi:very-short-patch-repair endonuclease